MRIHLPILDHGCCEPFKAGIHGTALVLAVLMGAYNAAAWLRRRERHLAINAVVYCLLAEFERHHVGHHIEACRELAKALKEIAEEGREPNAA